MDLFENYQDGNGHDDYRTNILETEKQDKQLSPSLFQTPSEIKPIMLEPSIMVPEKRRKIAKWFQDPNCILSYLHI